LGNTPFTFDISVSRLVELVMARALRLEFEGALYHLCARGNRRERIFGDEKDCRRFLALLGESLGRYEVELHAYVLLPNHFHLLARTRKPNLSRWMHWLMAAYSIAFNRRHKKVGASLSRPVQELAGRGR